MCINTKKVLGAVLALTAITALSSCTKKAAAPEKAVTLVMAEVNPPETLAGRTDQAFKEKVEELSNGTITIDLHCSGILGDEKQVMNIILGENSSIDLTRTSANLTKYGGKESQLVSIPFTFSNAEHFWKFADSPEAAEILNEPYENNLGVKGLFFFHEGFRHLFATEKISGIEDLKGRKMRVSGDVLTNLAKSLKAEPIEMAFTDLYSGMQTGKIDVAEQPLSNYLTNNFHKVAPYMILDGHMLGVVQVVVNSKTWNSLSENQQKIIMEAAKFAQNYSRTLADEHEEKILSQLKSEGATIVEVTDITPWQDACKDMIAELSKDFPELYKKILATGK